MISYNFTHPFPPIEGDGVDSINKSFLSHSSEISNKKYYGTYCNDEEWKFFMKYGEPYIHQWFKHTPKEKEDFERYIRLYQSFWELYYENYEDLCLYAIMYHNIKITAYTDVKSVKFFTSKSNEIKGFKARFSKQDRCHLDVALLYLDNRNIFTHVFSKYINCASGYEMSPNKSGNVINDFINDQIASRIGIINLTDNDCKKVLMHKDELLLEYKRAYADTLEGYVTKEYGIANSQIFFKSQFIPYYGRISTKLTDSSVCYDRVSEAKITPILNAELKDKILSKDELFIVGRWCRCIETNYEAKQKIESERQEKQRRLELEKQRKAEEEKLARISFNKKNSHYRDSEISFNIYLHQYSVRGVILQSVTNFVEGCFPKFDAEFHAKRKAAEKGISPKEVLDMWEQKGRETRELGTNLHKKIENYFQEIESPDDDAFRLFRVFANKMKLVPYRTEWTVYDWDSKIAGTIDFVDYQNDEYIIYDWKRSDKLIENGLPVKNDRYGGKGNYPLSHLDNSTYYHYALQLSLYKYILEKNYGMRISDLRLGVFHPSYDKPYILRIPYLEKEIKDLFNLRSEVIF